MSDYVEKEETGAEKIDLMRVIDVLWRGFRQFWIFLLILAVLCAGLMVFREKRGYQPRYASSATFTITSDNQSLYGSSAYYNNVTASQMAKTFPYILTSGLLNKTVAADLGLDSIPATITAEALANTNLFTIQVTSSDPQMSYDVLESVIRNYPTVAEYVIGKTKMQLLDMTGVPSAPMNQPNYRRAAVRGFELGICLDLLLLVLYAMTRRTIHAASDFRRILNVECICAIPQISFKKRGSKNFRKDVSIYNKKISQSFVESVRVLRARLEKEAKKQDLKVLLVTSAAPGEGKSTIAANAAMALAMNRHKVVLLDCDLRNPSVRSTLNMEDDKPGVIEFLTGKAELQEVLQYLAEYKMYVIPGGKPYNNASEIIDTPRMRVLIEQLRGVADYVVLDTAPVGMLTDTAVLAEYADAALFVVRQDYARIDNIMEGIAQLAESRVHLAGCVLNGAEAGITGSGYYHRYYGKYGYSVSGETQASGPAES